MTPSGAQSPKKISKTAKDCSGHANCNLNNNDIATPIKPINNTPRIKYCLAIIL